MPHDLIWEDHGLIERYFGTFTGTEMTRVNEIVASDSRFDSLRWVIADFTEATVEKDAVQYHEEAAAMSYAAALTNDRMIVAVVTPDPLIASYARDFGKYALPFPFAVFSTLEEARQWITRKSPTRV